MDALGYGVSSTTASTQQPDVADMAAVLAWADQIEAAVKAVSEAWARFQYGEMVNKPGAERQDEPPRSGDRLNAARDSLRHSTSVLDALTQQIISRAG